MRINLKPGHERDVKIVDPAVEQPANFDDVVPVQYDGEPTRILEDGNNVFTLGGSGGLVTVGALDGAEIGQTATATITGDVAEGAPLHQIPVILELICSEEPDELSSVVGPQRPHVE